MLSVRGKTLSRKRTETLLDREGDERMRRVLQEAAKAFGWKPAPAPSRRGWGVACGIDSGSYAVLAAEVKVDPATGAAKGERVVCARDVGVVVNPEGATTQIEGCITMGLGYVLGEEVRIRDGKVLDENFDTCDATGARLFRLPMAPARVKAAIERGR